MTLFNFKLYSRYSFSIISSFKPNKLFDPITSRKNDTKKIKIDGPKLSGHFTQTGAKNK